MDWNNIVANLCIASSCLALILVLTGKSKDKKNKEPKAVSEEPPEAKADENKDNAENKEDPKDN